jgi:hypothetical protein
MLLQMVEVLKPVAGRLTGRGRAARLLAEPPRAVVLALCAAVLGLRRAEAWSNPQFWAEDGYFYERSYVTGWHSLYLPYAGYLHAVPRAVATLAVHLDPALAPGFFVLLATLLTLYVSARVLSPRCPLPRYAGLAALAVVLVPDTREVLLNIVNLQWVLAGGLILLLIARDPTGWAQWGHDAGAALFLGLTGPFSILLLPLFVGRAWSRRTIPSAALAALVAACALAQGVCLIMQPSGEPAVPGSWGAARLILPAVAQRIGGSLAMGSLLPQGAGLGVGTLGGILTLAGVGFLAMRPGPMRAERLMLGLAFLAILLASLFRTRGTLHEYFTPHSNSRYMFVPQLLAVWLLVEAACRKGRIATCAAVVLTVSLAVNLPRLREPAYADMQWARYVPKIRAGEALKIPINPPGWILTLPAMPK